MVGMGDLDGDGKADLVWRHGGNGQNLAWMMNGTAVRSLATLTAVTDLGWQVQGLADFDADGRADVVWRNTRTGRNILWTMDGATVRGLHALDDVTDLKWMVSSP
jgi:hypothetical protein